MLRPRGHRGRREVRNRMSVGGVDFHQTAMVTHNSMLHGWKFTPSAKRPSRSPSSRRGPDSRVPAKKVAARSHPHKHTAAAAFAAAASHALHVAPSAPAPQPPAPLGSSASIAPLLRPSNSSSGCNPVKRNVVIGAAFGLELSKLLPFMDTFFTAGLHIDSEMLLLVKPGQPGQKRILSVAAAQRQISVLAPGEDYVLSEVRPNWDSDRARLAPPPRAGGSGIVRTPRPPHARGRSNRHHAARVGSCGRVDGSHAGSHAGSRARKALLSHPNMAGAAVPP